MKKLLVTAACILTFAAGADGQTDNKNDNTKQTNTMKTIALTKADFLTKVANYETNPTEWKYLGDKPALVDFYASWCGWRNLQRNTGRASTSTRSTPKRSRNWLPHSASARFRRCCSSPKTASPRWRRAPCPRLR